MSNATRPIALLLAAVAFVTLWVPTLATPNMITAPLSALV